MKRKYIILFLLPLSLLLLFSNLTLGADKDSQGPDRDMGYVGAETCKECHEKQYETYARSIHFRNHVKGPASQDACETCHGPGAKHVEKGGGRGVDIFAFNADVDPEAKSARCLTCHQRNSTNVAMWAVGAHKRNDLSCDSCHDMHTPSGKQIPDSPTICFTCHKDIRSDANKFSHHPIIEGKVKCSDCHNTHGTLTKHMIKAESVNQLCYKCHADKRGPYVWEHPPVEENCTICHTTHGSRHVNLLVERTSSLCQNCHDAHGTYDNTSGFGGTNSDRHFVNRACLNCHHDIHGTANFYNSFTR